MSWAGCVGEELVVISSGWVVLVDQYSVLCAQVGELQCPLCSTLSARVGMYSLPWSAPSVTCSLLWHISHTVCILSLVLSRHSSSWAVDSVSKQPVVVLGSSYPDTHRPTNHQFSLDCLQSSQYTVYRVLYKALLRFKKKVFFKVFYPFNSQCKKEENIEEKN